MDASELEFSFESALEMLQRLRADGLFLRSRLAELDTILELAPGKCYEIDGESGVGKTQICYSLASQLLSTRKTARLAWIGAISLRTDHLLKHGPVELGLAEHDSLERLICRRAETCRELRVALTRLAEHENVHLVVLDDIDALLHDTAYQKEAGRAVQADVMDRIRKLTARGTTVVVTNHITHWRGYPAPALGTFWAAQIQPHHRFFVERRVESSDVRWISTMKPGSEETCETAFRIGANGLEAVEV